MRLQAVYIYTLRFLKFCENIRRARQIEGIAKAKAKGIYKGSKQVILVYFKAININS